MTEIGDQGIVEAVMVSNLASVPLVILEGQGIQGAKQNRALQKTKVPGESDLADADSQWNETVELVLVPHPTIQNPVPIELDHGMVKGERRLTVRRALAGYCLAHWSVECSEGHRLDSKHFGLTLSNRRSLELRESADLAPGFGAVKGL